MILPIGDEPNLPGKPIVTWSLIGLNIAIFVFISWGLTLQGVDPTDPAVADYLRHISRETGASPRALLAGMTAYDLFIFEHGFKPADPSLWDMLISMFLHGGWLHLAGNMLFLWIYGDNVEIHVGRVAYLLIYLVTGAAAVVLHAVFRLDSMIPMVGASGAISGVLGCYFLWFPRNTVRVLVVFIFFIQVIRLPARIVLGIFLVFDNLIPFIWGMGSSVAYGAHIGGFLGGLGSAALISAWTRRGSLRAGALRQPARESSSQAFRAALDEGNWSTALSLYTEMPMRERLALPDDDVVLLADWLVESGRLSPALVVLQRFIATHPMSPALPRAHLRAGLIHLKERRLPAARQHFLAVLDMNSTADEMEGARAGLDEVDRRQREAERFRFH